MFIAPFLSDKKYQNRPNKKFMRSVKIHAFTGRRRQTTNVAQSGFVLLFTFWCWSSTD